MLDNISVFLKETKEKRKCFGVYFGTSSLNALATVEEARGVLHCDFKSWTLKERTYCHLYDREFKNSESICMNIMILNPCV